MVSGYPSISSLEMSRISFTSFSMCSTSRRGFGEDGLWILVLADAPDHALHLPFENGEGVFNSWEAAAKKSRRCWESRVSLAISSCRT